jgi:hypothetical protein
MRFLTIMLSFPKFYENICDDTFFKKYLVWLDIFKNGGNKWKQNGNKKSLNAQLKLLSS